MKKNLLITLLFLSLTVISCYPAEESTNAVQSNEPDSSDANGWWYDEALDSWCVHDESGEKQCMPMDGSWAEDCSAPNFNQMWICAEEAYLAQGGTVSMNNSQDESVPKSGQELESNQGNEGSISSSNSSDNLNSNENQQQNTPTLAPIAPTSGPSVPMISFPLYGATAQIPKCGTAEYDALANEYWDFFTETVEDLNTFFVAEAGRLGWDYTIPVSVNGSPYLNECQFQTISDPSTYQPQYSVSKNEVILPHINLMLPIYARYGKVAVAFLMAHEWGHGVTYTSGMFASRIGGNELLVDCYAGAYLRHAILVGRVPEGSISDMNDFVWTIAEDDYFIDHVQIHNWLDDNQGWHGTPLDRQLAVKGGLESSGINGCEFGQAQVQIRNFRMEVLNNTIPLLAFGFEPTAAKLSGVEIQYNVFIYRADGQNALTADPNYDNGRGYLFTSNSFTPTQHIDIRVTDPLGRFLWIPSTAFAERGEFFAEIQAIVDGELKGWARSDPWTIE